MQTAPGDAGRRRRHGRSDRRHCSLPGNCLPPADYVELRCNENADCSNGKLCCAYFINDGANLTLERTYCDTACDLQADQETPACTSDADCDFPFTCGELFGATYPDYRFYLPP